MPTIIDGYNLLHAINKSFERETELDDLRLCRSIGQYLKITGETGRIVFDGIGPPEKTGFDYIRNLEVIFTGQRTDADTVIENEIKTSTAPKNLTVVTNDRQILKAARKRKAATVKSETFWSNICKILQRSAKNPEPQQKTKGLSQSETDQWMKFFDIQ